MITDRQTTYHFIGIKGSGMSALALIMHGKGFKVQGSDNATYYFTQQGLEEADIPMMVFDADNITEGLTIIAGNAFKDDHEEIVRAKELGLPFFRYEAFLGKLIEGYKSIAVSGCHGKTSTTGLLAHTLKHLAPLSYLIGDGTGVGNEEADYFALEACEYRRHFLAYKPDYAIITNIDYDHPDYFTSIEDVVAAFQSFSDGTTKAVIACGEDSYLRQLETNVPIYYYGFDASSTVYATNITRTPSGSQFNVMFEGRGLGHFEVPTYGKHNILNALAVITVLTLEGFEPEAIAQHLATFGGVKRRFSVKQVNDLTIIDDYAHHPAEIRATIDATKQRYPGKRCVAVFQPHTFTRTVALLNDFAEALNLADDVYLCDIFHSAREEGGNVKIEDLAALIDKPVEIVSAEHLSPLMKYEQDVLVFMGAGDVDKISQQFEKVYAQLHPNNH